MLWVEVIKSKSEWIMIIVIEIAKINVKFKYSKQKTVPEYIISITICYHLVIIPNMLIYLISHTRHH